MTFEQLQAILPWAQADDWHQHPNGGGWVQNSARVSGNARVYGNARVSSPLLIQGSRDCLSVSAHGRLSIGCETRAIEWWEEHYDAMGRKHGYTPAQIAEYRKHIQYCKEWMEACLLQ